MPTLLAIAQTSGALAKWVATLCALAISMAHPAPRRASPHHHQPITLPELASLDCQSRLPVPSASPV